MLIFLDVLYTQKRVWVSSSMELEIPPEINDHFKIFGKDADEVDYNSIGPCPLCGSRVDEFNFCACGGNMGCD